MLDADQFAAHLVLQGLADNTVRAYRCMFQRWCDYCADVDRDPCDPDPLTVRAWASQLHGSRSLIAQARAMVGHLCTLVDVDNCAPAIPLPRTSRKPRSKALTRDQARQLARAADGAGQAGLAVLVGLYTGARRSEIASLAWTDVDLEAGEVTFTRTKTRDRHTVPLHPALHARLERRMVPGEWWVFPGRHGGHVCATQVWEWVREVARQAGIGKVTPHQLRHTVGAEMYETARDVLSAQDMLGHTDPSITAGYARRRDDQVRAAMLEALDWLDEPA